MTTGLEIRAQIDTENVRGLLLINGGASVALLAFLPSVIDKPGYEPLVRAILWGMLFFQLGLLFAVIHNRLRRICSLTYEQHQYQPPPCKILGVRLREPCVCLASILIMWLSVVAFLVGGVIIFRGGMKALDQRYATIERTKEVQGRPAEVSPNSSLHRSR